jgi:hypothetical protein
VSRLGATRNNLNATSRDMTRFSTVAMLVAVPEACSYCPTLFFASRPRSLHRLPSTHYQSLKLGDFTSTINLTSLRVRVDQAGTISSKCS